MKGRYESYVKRDDVALLGFAVLFNKKMKEHHLAVSKLIDYQVQRGCIASFDNIEKPVTQQWANVMEIMEEALALEKEVNESLLDLSELGKEHGDSHLVAFLGEDFLKKQSMSIYTISQCVTKLKRCSGKGLIVTLVDMELEHHSNPHLFSQSIITPQ
ncbi:soma ferritin-like isoform X2 [Artemia franciscana]|uniref:soma ferritin-like isoform X2 n=1 Tax=Artemia franciscana TaxID=6661 RepID=UPI0032DA626B